MNPIKTQATRSTSEGEVPSLWELFFQFGRVIWLGAVATLGIQGRSRWARRSAVKPGGARLQPARGFSSARPVAD